MTTAQSHIHKLHCVIIAALRFRATGWAWYSVTKMVRELADELAIDAGTQDEGLRDARLIEQHVAKIRHHQEDSPK